MGATLPVAPTVLNQWRSLAAGFAICATGRFDQRGLRAPAHSFGSLGRGARKELHSRSDLLRAASDPA